jgi:putative transposase
MARPLRIQYENALYHVTARGNERGAIYRSDRDRMKFMELMKKAYERNGVIIHAYCLMSNHYHLLLETPYANLSETMRDLNGGYTTYFNVKHKRRGHLFQGRYKAIVVEKEAHLVELTRYIHLNPVRAGMVEMPEQYEWSSYGMYLGTEKEVEWIKTGWVLARSGKRSGEARKAYRKFVERGIGAENKNPLRGAVAGTVLGSEEFVSRIIGMLGMEKQDVELPATRALTVRPGQKEVAELVLKEYGISSFDEGGRKAAEARRACIHLMRECCGMNLKEVGQLFSGISYSRISHIAIETGRDEKMRRDIMKLKKILTPKPKPAKRKT